MMKPISVIYHNVLDSLDRFTPKCLQPGDSDKKVFYAALKSWEDAAPPGEGRSRLAAIIKDAYQRKVDELSLDLSNDDLGAVTSLPDISHLQITKLCIRSSPSNSQLATLSHLPTTLRGLTIEDCPKLTKLNGPFPNLKTLTVKGCDLLTLEDPAAELASLKILKVEPKDYIRFLPHRLGEKPVVSYLMTVNQFLEKRNTSGESIWKRPIGTNCPLSLDEFDPANLGPDDIQKEVNLKQQVVLVCRNPNSEETERHYDLYDGVKFFKCLGLHELDECPSDSQRIQTYPWAATSSVKWPEKVNHPESRVSLTPENAFGMVDLMAVRTALPTPEPVALTEN